MKRTLDARQVMYGIDPSFELERGEQIQVVGGVHSGKRGFVNFVGQDGRVLIRIGDTDALVGRSELKVIRNE